MVILITYWAMVNVVAFLIMGHDKARSRKQGWRVPEKRLFLIAAVGGALGMWAGMRAFRHKTRHMAFALGIPALTVVNMAVFSYTVVTLRLQ
jgi:uncharacterized membrane protein YsdA (DUF1294 family)